MQFDKRIYQALVARKNDHLFHQQLHDRSLHGTYRSVIDAYNRQHCIKLPYVFLKTLYQKRYCARLIQQDQALTILNLCLFFVALSIFSDYLLHFANYAATPILLIGAAATLGMIGLSIYMIQKTTQREMLYYDLMDAQINVLLDYAEFGRDSAITDDQLLNFLSDLHHTRVMMRMVDKQGFKLTQSDITHVSNIASNNEQAIATLDDESCPQNQDKAA